MAISSRETMARQFSSKRKSSSTLTEDVLKTTEVGRRKGQERGSQNGSGKTTKEVKICLDILRRGYPKSRSYSRGQDKAGMEK